MCGRLDEDGGHLLFKCKHVKEVWRALNLEEIRCKLVQAASAREVMEEILLMEPKVQVTVVMLLYIWWRERNTWREEERRRSVVAMAYSLILLLHRLIKLLLMLKT